MKRKYLVQVMTAVLITACGTLPFLFAQENAETRGNVTVPWDEFKKLLRLDTNEIVLTLDMFQKLLVQTGVKTPPPYTVKEGNVVLSRTEFTKLIDQMKPPWISNRLLPLIIWLPRLFIRGKCRPATLTLQERFMFMSLKEEST